MLQYEEFLKSKVRTDPATGLNAVGDLNPMLFPQQRDIVNWALRRGRAAIWADCGMGKGPMALEYASNVPGEVLIVAPLAVSQQFKRESEKFGIEVGLAKRHGDISKRITVTNYESLHNFNIEGFNGIVLDESSILKSVSGKTRTELIERCKDIPFRLCCTATPAPNDHMELGSHSEFLGVMSRTEMLSTFFVHDGGETSKWRLKGHAEGEFWQWMASWAVMIRKPSDLGYSDEGFELPPLEMHEHITDVDEPTEGFLFAMEASTLADRIKARRSTVDERVAEAVKIINEKAGEPWIIWCNLNDEQSALEKALGDRVLSVHGSLTPDEKEWRIVKWLDGDKPYFLSKPSVAGFGLNFQRCNNMIFVGISDSYEAFYQAVRRCWRFGQTKPVNCHIVAAETEGAVLSNIKRKEVDATKMAENMVKHMADINIRALRGAATRKNTAYEPKIEMILPKWL